jgi:hypothetical protein
VTDSAPGADPRGAIACRGMSLIDALLAVGVSATLLATAVPLTAAALDEVRTAMAARYLQARIVGARMQAIRRSARVALRFEPVLEDYRFAEYLDGNGNGVRTAEIGAGIDPEIAPRHWLRDSYAGVSFGLLPNVPDVDGVRSVARGDGVRIGVSRLLTLGPDGTATSGTLYLHGRRSQYAIRVLGATGRTRLLRFDSGGQQWISR